LIRKKIVQIIATGVLTKPEPEKNLDTVV